MRTKLTIVITSAMFVCVLAPPVIAAGDLTGCNVVADRATNVNGVYVQGAGTSVSLYKESNDIPGLQQNYTFCADGRVLPPDTCILPHNLNVAADCALKLVGGL